MMTVKAAKEHCGYQDKPVLQTCGNCGAFASTMKLATWMEERNAETGQEEYTVEKNGVEKDLRCADHGFAVKKMAACKLWRSKAVTKAD